MEMIDLRDESRIAAELVDIRWERINLYLTVNMKGCDENEDFNNYNFYGINGLFVAQFKFDFISQKGQEIVLKCNITNNGYRCSIPLGKYSVLVCQKENILAELEVDINLVKHFENLSRSFLYGSRRNVYSVSFYVAEHAENLCFRVHMMAAASVGQSYPGISFFRRIKNAVKSVLGTRRDLLRMMYAFFSIFRKKNRKKKTVLFMTEQSSKISSNLSSVFDRMIKRGLDKDYKIIYSAREQTVTNLNKVSWIKFIRKLAKSDFIFLDDHAPVLDWLELKDNTLVVQLWHAGAGFKSSGYSRWGRFGAPAPVSCHRQYDFGIAGSKNIAHFFAEAFGMNNERILPTGMPRMDIFLNKKYRKKKTKELYELFPACRDKKVILFAPTYRGMNKMNAYYPYDHLNLPDLYELCSDQYVFLFKMHPWVTQPPEIPEQYHDRFLDVGHYPNINDLFYITDLLITDYSSGIFEYSLMRKPMLFYAYDEIQYSFTRGFHRPYRESAPGKVCNTFQEVINAIKNEDYEFKKVEDYIIEHFDYIDSGASDRVIDWILLDKLPEDIKEAIKKRDEQNQAFLELDFTGLADESLIEE